MKFEWPWKSKKITLEKDLKTLEAKLAHTFHPVEPRTEFVQDLRTKLVGKPKKKWLSLPNDMWQKGLLVAGGVVSVLAMVLNGVRLVSTVVNMLSGKGKTAKGEPAAA